MFVAQLPKAPYISNSSLIDDTGFASYKMAQILSIAGIAAKQFYPEYDAYHVVNLNALLQSNGCFQKDFDFYKNGGCSAFTINYEQAVKLLDFEYSTRELQLPEPCSAQVDGVMCSGIYPHSVGATLFKRLNSLQASIEDPQCHLQYRTIHVACKDEEIKNLTSEIIEKNYKDQFSGIEFKYIVATDPNNIGNSCLAQLNGSGDLEENYVVISDGTSSGKDLDGAKTNIDEKHNCLGVASAPIKDWKKEMEFYGYPEALRSVEKGTEAWLKSEMNFKAREINRVCSSFCTYHKISLVSL